METTPQLIAAVRGAVLGLCTGDPQAIRRIALPHPDLARLSRRQATPTEREAVLADLDSLQVVVQSELAGRHVLHVFFRGLIHPMVAVQTPDGWRFDLRFAIAASDPEPEAFGVARRFLAAMLLGDRETLHALAVDPTGLELLVSEPPPAGEVDQLLHVASTMPLTALALGETMPDLLGGVTTVSQRHLDHGYQVLLGLFGGAELPFLVKTFDGTLRVSPAPFIRAAAKARGAVLS